MRNSVVDTDPGDLSQQLDEAGEFHVEPLDVEVQPSSEGEADLDLAAELADEEEYTQDEDEELGLADEDEPTSEYVAARVKRDTGDLYGVHLSPAADRDFDDPEERGESFAEELREHAAEGGTLPEHEVVVIDESEDLHPTHHSTESGDRPVADKGAGGPGGL